MQISKDECDKEFCEKKLYISNERCSKCEFYYLCPYIMRSSDEKVNGS